MTPIKTPFVGSSRKLLMSNLGATSSYDCDGRRQMNPLELADRLREDYRRFTWTTFPVADQGLRDRLEHLVDEESLLWRGPYLSVQPRFALDASLAALVERIGLPAEVVAAFPQVDRLF